MPEKMTMKEKVLKIILRRGPVGKSPLLQGSKASSDELKTILGDLEREEKIKSWPYRSRAGEAAVYTLPDAKDPRTKEMLEGPYRKAKKKAPPAKAVPAALPVPRDGGAKPTPRPAENGSPYAATIADLEARRTAALNRVEQINTAIATLRALA